MARRLEELGGAVPTRDDDVGLGGEAAEAALVDLNADAAAEAARAAERRAREAQRRRVEAERARELRARDVERARGAEEEARAELRRRELEEEERAAQRLRHERERLESVSAHAREQQHALYFLPPILMLSGSSRSALTLALVHEHRGPTPLFRVAPL